MAVEPEYGIKMTEARNVKVGDVFSTDSGVVMSTKYLSAQNAYHIVVLAHGVEKSADIHANKELPIWKGSRV